MPYNPSTGNYSLPAIYIAIPGTVIIAAQHNVPLEDIATALNQVVLLSGIKSMTGPLNMGGSRIINVGAPTDPDDAARLADVSIANPKVTTYATAGTFTHTFDTDSTHFTVEGCGGGGAGAGNTTATGTDPFYGGGGHSGWWYITDPILRGAIVDADLEIGAGGTSTSPTKTNGGDTTYDDGTNVIVFPGGLTPLALSPGTGPNIYQYNQPSTPSNPKALYSPGGFGSRGIGYAGTDVVAGGKGGDSPFGRGGPAVSTGASSNGNPGVGNGSGGSGSIKTSGGAAYNGGAGRPGIIIIREWTE